MSRAFGESSLTTRPPISIVPEVGASSPATIRSAVVLPHPDGPTSTMNSPSATVWSSASTATTLPSKTLVTRWKATSAISP
jgi:hypothetical protein